MTEIKTWDDYHKMEKPIIKLESAMNFETLKRGHPLKINPFNHGFTKEVTLNKAMARTLEFEKITENGMIKCYSERGNYFYYKPKNLLIIDEY